MIFNIIIIACLFTTETGVYFSIIFKYSLRITLRVFQKEVKRLPLKILLKYPLRDAIYDDNRQ